MQKVVTRTGITKVTKSICCNLLAVQDLWQAHYQILLIILLNERININLNIDTNKKCVTCKIKYKHCNSLLEYTNFKDDLIEYMV